MAAHWAAASAAGCSVPLCIERGPHGWVQRASYTHPDMHDELIDVLPPLASPFAALAARSGAVAVYSFVLIGDQNAGKSTFLHAFVGHGDASWLELTSHLPILTSSFLNARLLAGADALPMDEPPFLDTDIGRATLLLTLEDFAFFCDEFDLDRRAELEALAAARTCHVAVQLIEVGGDHLDRMATWREGGAEAPTDARGLEGRAAQPGVAGLEGVLAQSERLLADAARTVYFVNTAALLHAPGGGARLLVRLDELDRLLRRLRYLRGALPPHHPVLFHLSRLAPAEEATFDETSARMVVRELSDRLSAQRAGAAAEAAHDAARLDADALLRRADHLVTSQPAAADGAPFDDDLCAPPAHARLLCGFLPALLDAALALDTCPQPPLALEGALVASHLAPPDARAAPAGGSTPAVDVHRVVATLARLVHAGSGSGPPARPPAEAPTPLAASHLLACFRDVGLRSAAPPAAPPADVDLAVESSDLAIEMWVGRDTWAVYLDEQHEALELPAAALLAAFERATAALADARLCILHYCAGHADLSLRCTVAGAAPDGGSARLGTWRAGAPRLCDGAANAAPTQMRFPYFAPLLRVMERPLAAGLPAEWWLGVGTDGPAAVSTAVSAADLRAAVEALNARLQRQLFALDAARRVTFEVFLFLLEDLCLAHALLRRLEGRGGAGADAAPAGTDAGDGAVLSLRLAATDGLVDAVATLLEAGGDADSPTAPRPPAPGRHVGWSVELELAVGDADDAGVCLPCDAV